MGAGAGAGLASLIRGRPHVHLHTNITALRRWAWYNCTLYTRATPLSMIITRDNPYLRFIEFHTQVPFGKHPCVVSVLVFLSMPLFKMEIVATVTLGD